MTFVALSGSTRACCCSLRTGRQPAPHLPHRDQAEALGRHAHPGQPMGIEQHLIIEGHMTPSAMRPLHARQDAAHPVQAANADTGVLWAQIHHVDAVAGVAIRVIGDHDRGSRAGLVDDLGDFQFASGFGGASPQCRPPSRPAPVAARSVGLARSTLYRALDLARSAR
jgi:hypothetical protein